MDTERTGDTQGTTDVQRAYIADLRELRKDYGCTPERLRQRSSLHTALSTRIRSSKRQSTIESCITELKKMIGTLGDTEKRTALLAALALDERFKGRTLGERREMYQDTFTTNRRPDIRTLQRWEDKAIEAVVKLVIDVSEAPYIPAGTQSRITSAGPSSQESHYSTSFITHTLRYSNKGILASAEMVRWIRAIAEDADPYIRTQHMYVTETGPAVVELHPLFGGILDHQYEAAGGSVVSIFKLHRRLKPEDGDFPIGYIRTIHGTRRTDPVAWWEVTSSTEGAKFEFRIIFHPNATPKRAWWFIEESVAYGEREPDMTEGRHLEILDDGCYIFKSFENTQSGLCYGVAWIWEDGDI